MPVTALINITAWLFAMDAAVSTLHELADCTDTCRALAGARNWVALLAALASQVLLIVWIVTPRVPALLAVTTGAFTAWATLGVPPLPLFTAADVVLTSVSVVQLLLAAMLIQFIRRRSGGRWWLHRSNLAKTSGGFWRSTGLAVAATVASLALVTLAVPSFLFGTIMKMTDGYITFARDAVMLEQRRFRAPESDTVVDLIGMVHLGERDTYETLFASLTDAGTVVLAEGVTDENEVLSDGLSYQGLAQSLGLTQQPDLRQVLARRERPVSVGREAGTAAYPEIADGSQWPHIRHADVDAGQFAPATISFLNQVNRTLQVRTMDAWRALFSQEPPASLEYDILTRRNEQLIATLDEALEDYGRVVIPWGAMHLPVVEAALVQRGFELVSAERRPIIFYATIWNRLTAPST